MHAEDSTRDRIGPLAFRRTSQVRYRIRSVETDEAITLSNAAWMGGPGVALFILGAGFGITAILGMFYLGIGGFLGWIGVACAFLMCVNRRHGVTVVIPHNGAPVQWRVRRMLHQERFELPSKNHSLRLGRLQVRGADPVAAVLLYGTSEYEESEPVFVLVGCFRSQIDAIAFCDEVSGRCGLPTCHERARDYFIGYYS